MDCMCTLEGWYPTWRPSVDMPSKYDAHKQRCQGDSCGGVMFDHIPECLSAKEDIPGPPVCRDANGQPIGQFGCMCPSDTPVCNPHSGEW